MQGPWAVQAVLLLLALAVVQAAAAVQTPGLALPLPTVFVHLSDLHFSTNVHGKYWEAFGDREGDVTLWSQAVVPRLQSQAVLITGDLTDSKVRVEHVCLPAYVVAAVAFHSTLSHCRSAFIHPTSPCI